MIREAHPSERKPVINVAKRLYPGSGKEIDALAAQIEAEEKQPVGQQGLETYTRASLVYDF